MSTRLGVDFLPGLQEALILDRGLKMVHMVAISCFCRVEDTFAGNTDDGKQRRLSAFCQRCGGEGWLYRDAQLVTGMATNIRQQRNILDAGITEPGDMMFSILPASGDGDSCGEASRRVSAYDKFIATWAQPIHDGNVIVRGAANMGENKLLNTQLNPDEDRLWYEPAKAIWCESEDGTVYNEGADFTLGPGKIIKWMAGGPVPGTRYAIKYEAYCEWICFQGPNERRDRDGKDLGQQIMLRRRHIVYVNSSPLATADDKISIASRTSC
jgi:hypothetical protein